MFTSKDLIAGLRRPCKLRVILMVKRGSRSPSPPSPLMETFQDKGDVRNLCSILILGGARRSYRGGYRKRNHEVGAFKYFMVLCYILAAKSSAAHCIVSDALNSLDAVCLITSSSGRHPFFMPLTITSIHHWIGGMDGAEY